MKDGGPAFPGTFVDFQDGFDRQEFGMSLRDWFAGQALAASAAMYPFGENRYSEEAACWAYSIADAMLKKRKETKNG